MCECHMFFKLLLTYLLAYTQRASTDAGAKYHDVRIYLVIIMYQELSSC